MEQDKLGLILSKVGKMEKKIQGIKKNKSSFLQVFNRGPLKLNILTIEA